MNKWLKKTFVTIITILTFGLISPYQSNIQAASQDDVNKSPEKNKIDVYQNSQADELQNAIEYEYTEPEMETETEPDIPLKEIFVNEALKLAEEQCFLKFGNRIGPVIEDEFTEIVLPNIEKAIREVAERYKDEDLEHLVISEKPGRGMSEKIFHIYDRKTGQDLIRFHVRRELRPKEGYWFNFHYHTYHDDFHAHYGLGDIYWDKNTPPQWMN